MQYLAFIPKSDVFICLLIGNVSDLTPNSPRIIAASEREHYSDTMTEYECMFTYVVSFHALSFAKVPDE
jgi:hypothetical protein